VGLSHRVPTSARERKGHTAPVTRGILLEKKKSGGIYLILTALAGPKKLGPKVGKRRKNEDEAGGEAASTEKKRPRLAREGECRPRN